MTPPAWSCVPEIGFIRTDTVTSVNTPSPIWTAGNSAVAVWQRALGGEGAPASWRSCHEPLKTAAPTGTLPAGSWSNEKVSAGAGGPGEYRTVAVPEPPPHPAARTAVAIARVRRARAQLVLTGSRRW